MAVTTHHNGHKIVYDYENEDWLYQDNNESTNKERPCKHCGRYATEEGHDYCMANLPGVMNACCGHGGSNKPYVQFLDGYSIHGEDAERIMLMLKYHRR